MSEKERLSENVGKKIKFFRRLKGMSQDQLADAICKSKSTLSKYENGLISIDVDSLYDIAVALDVELAAFMDMPVSQTFAVTGDSCPFGGKGSLYLHYYDGRTKRVVKTLINKQPKTTEDNVTPCKCYWDVPSWKEFENCKYFYNGAIDCHDMVTYINLFNAFNKLDQIKVAILNPFHDNMSSWGMILAISYNPIAPVAIKFRFTTNPNDEFTPEELSYS